jgi:hypothetical protein
MADKATVAVGPWPKGIDNRSPDYAVAPDALRNAVDVDLLQDGRLRRRQGYARVVTAIDPHSLYTCPVGTFFVSQNTLYRLNSDDSTTAILTGLAGRPVTYEYFNGDVYLSDGIVAKKLVDGTTEVLWGVPTPSSAPLLAATSGSIAAGSFVGAVSFVTISGEESGLSTPAMLTTSATGGVQFLAFPSPPNSAVVSIRLYLSTPGGSVLYHVGDIAGGTTSYTVSTLTDTGKEADLTVYSMPPASNIIRHKDGRMYCIVDDIVWFTEPFALGRIKTAHSFWQFPASVTIFEPVEAGVYIVADKTYFYRFTDPNEVKVENLFNYGAIPYTAIRLPHGEGVMWQSTRGAIMADEGGKVKNIQEDRVATGTADAGAAILREQNGLRQFVAVLSDARTSSLTATDFMEAEIIRKGA